MYYTDTKRRNSADKYLRPKLSDSGPVTITKAERIATWIFNLALRDAWGDMTYPAVLAAIKNRLDESEED